MPIEEGDIYVALYDNNETLVFSSEKLPQNLDGMTMKRECKKISKGTKFGSTSDKNRDWYYERTYINKVIIKDRIVPSSIAYWFEGCTNLEKIEQIKNLKTEKATSAQNTFCNCNSLTSLDVSEFNTIMITNMSNMFEGCSGLTSLDVSKFDTTNVTNMERMFFGCSSLKIIYVGDNWNTKSITASEDMFFWNE